MNVVAALHALLHLLTNECIPVDSVREGLPTPPPSALAGPPLRRAEPSGRRDDGSRCTGSSSSSRLGRIEIDINDREAHQRVTITNSPMGMALTKHACIHALPSSSVDVNYLISQ